MRFGDWFRAKVLTRDAISSKGIWGWETALMWPVRFLGQHLSQPCTAHCQICGTWSLSPWHWWVCSKVRPVLWLLMSEVTIDFPCRRFPVIWIQGWMYCRGLEQWLAFLYSVQECPLLSKGKGVRDTEFLYSRLRVLDSHSADSCSRLLLLLSFSSWASRSCGQVFPG